MTEHFIGIKCQVTDFSFNYDILISISAGLEEMKENGDKGTCTDKKSRSKGGQGYASPAWEILRNNIWILFTRRKFLH